MRATEAPVAGRLFGEVAFRLVCRLDQVTQMKIPPRLDALYEPNDLGTATPRPNHFAQGLDAGEIDWLSSCVLRVHYHPHEIHDVLVPLSEIA